MVILGLLMVLLAAGATTAALVENTKPTSMEILGVTMSNLSVGGIFLAGVVTALVFALGLFLMMGGAARARRRRQKNKTVVKDSRREAAELAAEKDRLQRELEQERTRRSSTGTTVVERGPVGTRTVGDPDDDATGSSAVDGGRGPEDTGGGSSRGLFRR